MVIISNLITLMEHFTVNSVASAPPTVADIEQMKRNVKAHDCKLSVVIWAGGTLLLVLTSMDDIRAMGIKAAAWLVCLPILLLLSLTHKADCYADVAGNERCAELYQACEQTPEGRAYRQAVLAQGRKFVNAELVMLKEWNIHRMASSACKTLYGISN